MIKTSLVLTILAPDRPGLVESIAQIVAEHGANWIESRMAHLAGHFAGILRVEVDAGSAEPLAASLRGLSQSGLELVIHPDASVPAPASLADRPLVRLDLMGQDRPGIVREITRVLARLGVNVEELATECTAAAETGHPVFHAEANLRLPAAVTEADLRVALEAVAVDLMVEIVLGGRSSR
jgi:glycine cleavage system regulatory protein